jgi:hypothetical protein
MTSSEVRAAYVRGARDAYESVLVGCDPLILRQLEEWLSQLEAWQEGDPPPPPYQWDEQAP